MDFSIVSVFNRSVSLELREETPFFSPEKVTVTAVRVPDDLNGPDPIKITDDRNVISLFGLLPDTEYEITVTGEDGRGSRKRMRTASESVLLDVRRFGAAGDGRTEDTAAVQAAIAACPKNGTVYVPQGTYHVRPLFFKSDMTFYLEKGATLIGDPDRKHYPVLPGMTGASDGKTWNEYNLASWEGNPLDSFASLITAIDAENLNIVGEGILDGGAMQDGADWWVTPKVRRIAWRPNTIFLERCRNVRVQGLTVQNSPAWTIHPYYCSNLRFIGLTIRNPYDSPNTDGFDPESCTDVQLLGTLISVGDDCIAIKSGKYYMAQYHCAETSGIEIRNCRMEHGHGAVTVGSEISGGVRNVHVRQCIFEATDRGIRVKTRRGRGSRSVLTDLVFDHIEMSGVRMPLTLNMFYSCDPDGHSDYVQTEEKLPVDERTPSIGRIALNDITCTGVNAAVVCAAGLPEMPVREIQIGNLSASFLPGDALVPEEPLMMDHIEPMAGRALYLKYVNSVKMHNVSVTGATGSNIIDNVTELDVR